MSIETRKIQRAILLGAHDEELEGLLDAVRQRQEIVSLMLVKGDRVRVSEHVRPLYIRGITGEVIGHRNGRIEVKMDPIGNHRVDGRIWHMTPGSISKEA